MTTDQSPRGDNEVFLRGRLAAEAELRTLPSGDELCTFRLTVDRPPGERAKVDSIDCVTANAQVRRSVLKAEPGAVLEVDGALHRRFWRGAQGPESRYEVQVAKLRVMRRRNAA